MDQLKITEFIAELEKLDLLQLEFEKKADRIHSSSPFCQLNEQEFNALDEAGEIMKQKALLWNVNRSLCPIKYKTLWQIAIENNLPVRAFGNEEVLKIYASDLKKLVSINI